MIIKAQGLYHDAGCPGTYVEPLDQRDREMTAKLFGAAAAARIPNRPFCACGIWDEKFQHYYLNWNRALPGTEVVSHYAFKMPRPNGRNIGRQGESQTQAGIRHKARVCHYNDSYYMFDLMRSRHTQTPDIRHGKLAFRWL